MLTKKSQLKLMLLAGILIFACSEQRSDVEIFAAIGIDEDPASIIGDHNEYTVVPRDIEKVFEEVKVYDPKSGIVSQTRTGVLTPEIWQMAARPLKYMTAEYPHIYQIRAFMTPGKDETETHVFTIYREPNATPKEQVFTQPGPPAITDEMMEKLNLKDGISPIRFMAKLSGMPDFTVPLRLPHNYFDAETIQRNSDEIQQARENRASFKTQLIENLVFNLGEDRVLNVEPVGSGAWVMIEVLPDALSDLMGNIHVAKLDLEEQEVKNSGCDTSVDLNPTDVWLLGEGRTAERMDIDRFLDAGLDGSISNGYNSNLRAGVVELSYLDDEAVAFENRLIYKYDCLNSPCTTVSNYVDDYATYINGTYYWCEPEKEPDPDNNATNALHATQVTSTFAGSYLNDEANGIWLGDHTWTGTGMHCQTWENASTGMAPGADIVFANGSSEGTAALVRAYEKMIYRDVDVLNISHSTDDGTCNISSQNALEDELEEVFDNGALVAVATGNSSSSTQCQLVTPADIPKTIAVGSLDAGQTTCQSDYQDCVLHTGSTALGGANLTTGGTTYTGEYSGIGLIAPQNILQLTGAFKRGVLQNDGCIVHGQSGSPYNYGWIEHYNAAATTGSSIATPHVSGAAILLKHWQLSRTNSWINNPGALQSILLSMGDRYDGAGSRSITDVSEKTGFGRIKLRLINNSAGNPFLPTAFTYRQISFSSGSQSYTDWAWPYALPTGTRFLKCVMFEHEDMSNKNTVSDIYLQVVRKYPDINGNCSSSSNLITSRTSQTHDLRHLVSFDAASLEGDCVQFQIIKRNVTSSGTTASLFCYFSGVADYETP